MIVNRNDYLVEFIVDLYANQIAYITSDTTSCNNVQDEQYPQSDDEIKEWPNGTFGD